MAQPLKAPELLDVEMKHVARLGMLVTHDGDRRLECCQAVEAGPPEPAGNRALTNPAMLADLAICLAAPPLFDHLGLEGCWQGMRAGFRA